MPMPRWRWRVPAGERADARAPGRLMGLPRGQAAIARPFARLPAAYCHCRMSSSSDGITDRSADDPATGEALAKIWAHAQHALHQRAGARHHQQRFERGAAAARLRDQLRAAAVRLGQTRVVQAESRYRQALERAREAAVNARSEVREAYAMQQGQYAIARICATRWCRSSSAFPRKTCCATTAC